MDLNAFRLQVVEAKDVVVKLRKLELDFEQSFKAARRKATWLNLAAFLAALFTALGAVAVAFPNWLAQYADIGKIITAGIALLSAGVPIVSKHYNWDEKAKDYLNARNKAEQARAIVKVYMLQMARTRSIEESDLTFSKARQIIDDLNTKEVDIDKDNTESAQVSFDSENWLSWWTDGLGDAPAARAEDDQRIVMDGNLVGITPARRG